MARKREAVKLHVHVPFLCLNQDYNCDCKRMHWTWYCAFSLMIISSFKKTYTLSCCINLSLTQLCIDLTLYILISYTLPLWKKLYASILWKLDATALAIAAVHMDVRNHWWRTADAMWQKSSLKQNNHALVVIHLSNPISHFTLYGLIW